MSRQGGGRSRGDGDMLRLFVAVLLPERWLALLSGVQQRLRDSGLNLRYVRPEGIHVTLRFLGETPSSSVAGIEHALAGAAAHAQPFELRLGDPGTFGPPGRPRVVWVGIEDTGHRLDALHVAIEDALHGAGIAREVRTERPHLTLARVPDRLPAAEAGRIGPAIAALPALGAPNHHVDSIALMRSELGSGGARYTALNIWRLTG